MASLYALAMYLRICGFLALIQRTQLITPWSPVYMVVLDGRIPAMGSRLMSLKYIMLLGIHTWPCVKQRASRFLPTNVLCCY
ncbi:hypothetical protein EDD17DRAFT_1634013 [Pisolithus thermaeus]|nr:hypothetical protein EV401DRAFT_2046972 [Pisolithus croceorrhizus]KAI6152848.1 hypothetical protein EDD17DRAFT_1634013 [Pisolithus thermaeus]